MTETPETVKSFITRMWTQSPLNITPEDFSTLMTLAIIGSQKIITEKGKDVLVPTADGDE